MYLHVPPEHVAPTLFVVSHVVPHAPQAAASGTRVSQPSVSGSVVLQSAQPGLHDAYEHVVPLQLASTLFVMSHAAPQRPQLNVVSVVPHPASAAVPASVSLPEPSSNAPSPPVASRPPSPESSLVVASAPPSPWSVRS